ncbi:hypothetical protein D3C78_1545250 [compost metagenome]
MLTRIAGARVNLASDGTGSHALDLGVEQKREVGRSDVIQGEAAGHSGDAGEAVVVADAGAVVRQGLLLGGVGKLELVAVADFAEATAGLIGLGADDTVTDQGTVLSMDHGGSPGIT